MAPTSPERLVNIGKVNDTLEEEPVNVWAASLRHNNNPKSSYQEDYLNEIAESGEKVIIIQTILDGAQEGSSVGLDIDIMDSSDYDKILEAGLNQQRIKFGEPKYGEQQENEDQRSVFEEIFKNKGQESTAYEIGE